MDRRALLLSGLALLIGTGLSSCYGPGYGPPPHAPAHGYRRKSPAGVDLVYDAGLGLYTVVGYPYYYYDNQFYRLQGGAWQISVDINGPWRPSPDYALPPGLRNKGGHGEPGRGRGPKWAR